ncbi:hypothetical protein BC834DRAFT_42080 [Gloeopeniophorella convolvens]|nr:hypothetical protein BC834DRAFT_42080 [Gloeopeniophorella convolvens]
MHTSTLSVHMHTYQRWKSNTNYRGAGARLCLVPRSGCRNSTTTIITAVTICRSGHAAHLLCIFQESVLLARTNADKLAIRLHPGRAGGAPRLPVAQHASGDVLPCSHCSASTPTQAGACAGCGDAPWERGKQGPHCSSQTARHPRERGGRIEVGAWRFCSSLLKFPTRRVAITCAPARLPRRTYVFSPLAGACGHVVPSRSVVGTTLRRARGSRRARGRARGAAPPSLVTQRLGAQHSGRIVFQDSDDRRC